ncbi:hypothetical protein [Maritalea myrionectae]|uniref:hypothetical protein n=1 Tax=Maritalea myrionectae TaxID=454601 RepID=UPI0004840219|nr:hypothetical protein [Maritalea myrionectae]
MSKNDEHTDRKLERAQQLAFLESNCGVTIKNLLFKQQGDEGSSAFKQNYAELLNLPEVAYWKNKIPSTADMTSILGSSDACFENSFGRLLSFGLSTKDILSSDLRKIYLDFVADDNDTSVYGTLARYLVAGYLFIGGDADKTARKVVLDRIDALFEFVVNSPLKFDIYVEPDGFSIPKAYRSKQLINPALYEDGAFALPLVHDIFIFAHTHHKLPDAYQRKIKVIVDYVADPQYQDFDYGYGLVKYGQNKFHFMGWSAHMPLFNDTLSVDYFKKGLVFRMPLFSTFENPNIRAWRTKVRDHFDEFRNEDGLYSFSNDHLPEVKNSYFLNGRHTSLNENRRRKAGKIVESTFYAYWAGL